MKFFAITQRVDDIVAINERRDSLDQNWAKLFLELDIIGIPVMNRLSVNNFEAIHNKIKFSGIILSGGNDLAIYPNANNIAPERDQLECSLIEFSAQNNMPLLGVCRGAQMLANYYGTELIKIANHVRIKHTIIDNNLKERLVNSYHTFGIQENNINKELIALAKDTDGHIEAFRHVKYNQWGIMWHPERETPFDKLDVELLKQIISGGL